MPAGSCSVFADAAHYKCWALSSATKIFYCDFLFLVVLGSDGTVPGLLRNFEGFIFNSTVSLSCWQPPNFPKPSVTTASGVFSSPTQNHRCLTPRLFPLLPTALQDLPRGPSVFSRPRVGSSVIRNSFCFPYPEMFATQGDSCPQGLSDLFLLALLMCFRHLSSPLCCREAIIKRPKAAVFGRYQI